MNKQAVEEFVESWGTMGTLFGINRSIARVHAILMMSDGPSSLDDIAERLQISRGNASMSLKELRNWGVIRRVHEPGDRRDFYESEPDVWRMLFRIMTERKRRELDPALAAARQALDSAEPEADGAVHDRLAQMVDLLSTLDRLATRALADEQTSRAMLKLVTGSVLSPPG